MENNKPASSNGDLSHVNQVIELEAERPRKIMIEVKVKDMSLFGDEEDDQHNREDDESNPREDIEPIPREDVEPIPREDVDPIPREDVESIPREDVDPIPREDVEPIPREDVEPIPCPNTSDAPSISEVDHVWPKPGVNVPKPDNVSITIAGPSPPDACDDTNASFKRLLGQWVPQNDERSLRQHFYKYGPPPPVMPLPVAPPSSTESPTDRPVSKDEQVPENSTILPENKSETKEGVFEKPPLQADEVLELEKELIRSYNRLDPSKIKTFL